MVEPRTLPVAAVTASAPADSPSLADQAYAQPKQLIFDFALMPGDRVSETELAQRVAVSRTPLRAALQRLEREGFLQLLPRLGWQVAPLDFDVMDELYDLRTLLECEAARHLAERTSASLSRLSHLVTRLENRGYVRREAVVMAEENSLAVPREYQLRR